MNNIILFWCIIWYEFQILGTFIHFFVLWFVCIWRFSTCSAPFMPLCHSIHRPTSQCQYWLIYECMDIWFMIYLLLLLLLVRGFLSTKKKRLKLTKKKKIQIIICSNKMMNFFSGTKYTKRQLAHCADIPECEREENKIIHSCTNY